MPPGGIFDKEVSLKIYKTRYFHKWAKKALLPNESLVIAALELTDGLIDAHLGGNLVKKRIPLRNKGKRSGFRTIIAYKKGERSIFLFGFEKNEQDNIDKSEEEALKKLAKEFLILSQHQIDHAVDNGELIEVIL